MSKKIAILGAGPGGYVAAIRAAQLGASVTLIERENVGGTCLNWGCIPSKIMKTAADVLEVHKRAAEFGVVAEGPVRVDMKRLMERKTSLIKGLSEEILKLLSKNKIRYIKGHGRIEKSHLLSVDLEDGGTEEVAWDALVLALGTRPAGLANLTLDGHGIISSNEALVLEELPESLLIVGGGVIGCEFAFIFSSLGTRVTVVEALSRPLPLPSVDSDCSKIIRREMKKCGIKFMLNRVVEQVEGQGARLKVTVGPSPWAEDLKPKEKARVELETGKVLVCVGRRPNTGDVGLENIRLQTTAAGWIEADEHLATAVPDVYAIGDVLGPERIMLAHVASVEGAVAVENIMGGNKVVDYSAVPSAIFTMPEVACVGITDSQANERGMNVRTDSVNMRNISKAHVLGEISGHIKIISEKDTGRVLGVHMVGPHATDLIGEGTLAIKTGRTIQELSETIHAHPTLAEIFLETAYKAMDRPIHA